MLGLTWWHWLLIVAVCLAIGLIPRLPFFRRGQV